MRRPLTFSQYLLGQASLERPPFFYAYAGMWLHLIVASLLLLLFTDLPFLSTFLSTVVGSFCAGIVLYGLLSREYGLLVNLASYASSMGRLAFPERLGSIFLVVAILAALASGYLLLSREYRRYSRDQFGDQEAKVPAWISLVMGTVVVLICVFGLNLL